jgi:hypothetical protein
MFNRVPRAGLTAAIAGAALITGLLASQASAYHIPGAAYSGQVSGGGTISFSVSGDGSSVTNLTLTGPIETATCSLSSKQYTQPTPIANHSFDNGEVSGGFPNVEGAYGRFSVPGSDPLSSCRVTGTWSATTSASPAGSEECKAALAQMKKWKRARLRAEKAGYQAKVKKLQKKWLHARDERNRVC